ncbi:Ferric reductase domain protein protein transmembrane component domain protein [Thioalkalivibrio sulfidiphilus HL-EbGr7]|uniref:Protein-methionine-sulfoxide reductase heme-binding subunit MsrQ n=1 Tax=Thioalkalivibrio sulfidiphilus (strain HL-EbGR7) TaxID=396588 RepID=B8GRN4_THISH|nr:protein-methionine-sulfoxide reductase heme-binding subunit MsrQ [Thioalkalivibrio sulfidiphilus]ACL72588.1 Ferric reductase domain protein protein transmembrane component domain protein [Thioalkalivibrio sulfidiphilus HL-EbGr7]
MVQALGGLGGLGTNPIEYLTHETGIWALRLLCLTLLMTPLRRMTGWSWPMRLRRMLGLFAFFYACLHLSIWIGLDLFFDWTLIWDDVLNRPYITLGFTAWLLLLPLAVTSTDAMMRRLKRRWVQLHRLVYPAAILAVLHFWWLTRADYREPMLYGVILAVLLGWRVIQRWPWKAWSGSARRLG